MKKAEAVRHYLEKSVPDFKNNPDKLEIYMDAGKIIATGAESASFELVYTLNIIVKDFALPPVILFATLVDYLKVYQPELLHNPDKRKEGVKFMAERHNNESYDLAVDLMLTERVIVKSEQGINQIRYAPEPSMPLPLERWQIYINEQLSYEYPNP